MAAILYPSTLPCPQTSTVTPAERRALSSADRPREARNIQRDRLEYERVTWPAMDIPKADTILAFWRDTLQRGGAWFTADWPLPRGIHTQAVRKFREQPKWQFIAGGFWQLSALCEVRGRGAAATDGVQVWRIPHFYVSDWIFGPSLESVANTWRDEGLDLGGWEGTYLTYSVITAGISYNVYLNFAAEGSSPTHAIAERVE